MNGDAVRYVRVSTRGQAKEGYSLEYQVDEINRFCTAHHLRLLEIYRDEGISGAVVDEDDLTVMRDGLQRKLHDLKSRSV